MRKALVILIVLTCAAACSYGETVKSLRLLLPSQADPTIARIADILTRQMQRRCDVRVSDQGEAPLTVELTIEPGIGVEGFKITDGQKGQVQIIGNDGRGLLYGVGKFLHTSAYNERGFTPGTWRGKSVPAMPVRGMYLATHFHNFYQAAPIDEFAQYVEELSLWGINSFLFWYHMEEFNGPDDPTARAMRARLTELMKKVRDLGLNVSLGCIANHGYANSPEHLRADASTENHPGYHTRMGTRIPNNGPELCPSKPGVPEIQLAYCREKFDMFKDVGLDYWFIWPYDNGGCTCPKCAPWGANGYLRMAELIGRAYRQTFPKGKVILGTWYFDRYTDGEWAGLAARFDAQKPDWVDYIMADNFEDYPRFPLEKGVPGGFPLLSFPEISVWGQAPWGGYGANPHPSRLQKRWDETKAKLSGGFPYSEGIYEDLNKVICAQFYWSPDHKAMETVRDYAAYELSPEVADDVVTIVKCFEQNHMRDQVGESAVKAYDLVQQVDAKLSAQARRAWRWRLFCIRATIDREIYRNNKGQGRDEVFQQACAELTRISHAENATPDIRPVPVKAKKSGPE